MKAQIFLFDVLALKKENKNEHVTKKLLFFGY